MPKKNNNNITLVPVSQGYGVTAALSPHCHLPTCAAHVLGPSHLQVLFLFAILFCMQCAMDQSSRRVGGPLPPAAQAKSDADLHPSQRMVSACVGSLVTSTLLTPLDVVRVRLQVAPVALHSPEMCPTVVKMSNGIGDFLDTECAQAFKCDCRTNIRLLENQSTFRALRVLVQDEGLRSLYRTLPLSLLMTVPSVVIYYAGYDELRWRLLRRMRADEATVLSAALARTVATVAISPFELIRTKAQAVGSSTQPWHSLMRETSQKNGVRYLWRGVSQTLWRDVPFSIVYWLSYETAKAGLSPQQSGAPPMWVPFVAGAGSGMLSSLVTHPFDVAKTRIQTATADARALSHLPLSTFGMLRQIHAQEGVQGWMAGWKPRVQRITPACAIMISCYELSKRFLGTRA